MIKFIIVENGIRRVRKVQKSKASKYFENLLHKGFNFVDEKYMEENVILFTK